MNEPVSWLDEHGFRRCNGTVRTNEPPCATAIFNRENFGMVSSERASVVGVDPAKRRPVIFAWRTP